MIILFSPLSIEESKKTCNVLFRNKEKILFQDNLVAVKGENMKMLKGLKVISLAVNLPGPAAARRMCGLGARVLKIEPSTGDPMFNYNPDFYHDLTRGQELLTLDLKSSEDRERLLKELETADLLLTASRPDALARLGLGWDVLHARFPNLCQVAIIGYPPPLENEPGHDLTYQAKYGLLNPPQLPRTLIADMAGAEKATTEALALLLGRERGQDASCVLVPLSEAAEYMAEPFKYGLTASGGILGGALPAYNIYQASEGWVAVAALEPHFKKKMEEAIGFSFYSYEQIQPFFMTKDAKTWEKWAKGFDLPIVAIVGD